MTLEELEKCFEINIHALHDELNKQTYLQHEAGKGWVKAMDKRDTAKHVLQTKAAQLASAFRTSSLEKVTEAKITEYVNSHPEYIQQLQFLDKYTTEAYDWQVMKDAYETRKWMIREMVGIHLSGYYGSGLTDHEDKIEAIRIAHARRKEGISNE